MSTGIHVARRADQAALLAELLDEIRHGNVTLTERWARLHSAIINEVLSVNLKLLDGNGLATDSFVTPYGSLFVANHGAAGHDMTVTSSPPMSGAPPIGTGTALVRAGTAAVLNLGGTEYTIYGTAADKATVQAFVRAQPPTTGPA